jgi:FlaG/FlaF family flagellin (archaellin)
MKKNTKIVSTIIAVIAVIAIIVGVTGSGEEEYLGEAKLLSSPESYAKLNILEDETQIWEDGMRTDGVEGTYEWWYTDAEFKDGTTIVTVFYTKDGFDVPGEAHPKASLEITYPDGTTVSREVYEEEGVTLNASKEQCDVEIGTTSLKYVDGDYILSFEEGNLKYDAVMKSTIEMWRPETGYTVFGDEDEDFFAWFVAQPASDITATLNIDGSTQELIGTGYHDHNWGNIAMNEVVNHWYWGRAKIGDYNIITSDIIAEEAYGYARVPIIMIAKDGKIIEDDQTKTIIERRDTYQHEITGKFMDNIITFTQPSDDGIEYTIEYDRHEDILASSMLDALSPTKKFIAKLLGANPTYVRVLGDVILTIDDNGVETVIESEGLWEQMFFGSNEEASIGD